MPLALISWTVHEEFEYTAKGLETPI